MPITAAKTRPGYVQIIGMSDYLKANTGPSFTLTVICVCFLFSVSLVHLDSVMPPVSMGV